MPEVLVTNARLEHVVWPRINKTVLFGAFDLVWGVIFFFLSWSLFTMLEGYRLDSFVEGKYWYFGELLVLVYRIDA